MFHPVLKADSTFRRLMERTLANDTAPSGESWSHTRPFPSLLQYKASVELNRTYTGRTTVFSMNVKSSVWHAIVHCICAGDPFSKLSPFP